MRSKKKTEQPEVEDFERKKSKRLAISHLSSVSSTVRLPSSVRNRCGVSRGREKRGCGVEGDREDGDVACVDDGDDLPPPLPLRTCSFSSTRRRRR